ncbi:MAG: S41 family peptidase [Pseudomonadota bacterium]
MNKTFVAALAGAAFTAVVMSTPVPRYLGFADNTSAIAASPNTYRQLELFGDVFERVRSKYVETVEDEILIEAAIQGMLSDLDPYSAYLNPNRYRDMQVETRGEFGGLGIEVTMEEGFVKVVAPIDDTPASRAGLQPNDLISHIDAEPVLGLTMNEAIQRLRGPVNTPVELTIIREGRSDPVMVKLNRATITIESVRSDVIGKTGYVRISTFSEKTESGLRRAISNLKKRIGEPDGYVIDLRSNPGGLLDQAVAVSDAFLKSGEIVSTRGRDAAETERYNATRDDLAEGKPIIVLINGGSASASEIVAGALQDQKRATVLGMKSFGKGSVQTVIPLGGGGEGALRLTTARYFTPSGRSIHNTGIEPDIAVAPVNRPDAEGEAAPEPPATEGTEGEPEVPRVSWNEHQALLKRLGIKSERLTDDYQLARALEILQGIRVNSQVPN